jgi:uncharacterized protein YjbI with pentapeptide repeats
LTAASFIDCDLTDVKMAGADISGLVLDGSQLHSTDFDWAALLERARGDLSDEERVSVVGCSFKPFKLSADTTISRVDLSHCIIVDAVAPNVKLQDVMLRGAQLVRHALSLLRCLVKLS